MSGSRLGAAAAALAAALGGGPVSAAVDAGALQRGEQIYSRCAACHGIEGNRTGPQHCGLFGRRAGTAPGFAMYSQAMRESAIVWDARTLDRFVADPMKAVPGTAMGYAGVKDPKERADLIAWLQQATRAGRSCKPQP
jgi:cytochrome c